MRTVVASLVCAAVLTAASAGAGEPPLHKANLLLARYAAAHGYLVAPGFVPIVPEWLASRDPAALPLLVVSGDSGRTADAVAALGGAVHTRAGKVLSVTLPLGSVGALLEEPSVGFVEMPAPKRFLLNVSNKEVGAVEVAAGTGLPKGVDGTGVVLGLVDSGLDLSHPEMRNDDGTSRVKWLWNQDVDPPDSPPEDFGYGVECTGEKLDKATCNAADVIGHGTHVSGIMGGNGHKYPGMAPKGVYVVAKSNRFDRLVDAAAYVFSRAEKLGLPCTINMSLGGHYGAHDGTSAEEIGLAALTKDAPGHVIVAAAGNEGADTIHLGYAAVPEGRKTLLEVRDTAIFSTWSDPSAQIEFAVGVAIGSGQEITETDWYRGGTAAVQKDVTKDAQFFGTVGFSSGLYQPNGKMAIDVVITPDSGTKFGNPGGFQWYLKARGSGRFDAWSANEGLFTASSTFSAETGDGLVPGDTVMTVGMPASSPGIIAVAAYNTKNSWKDVDQQPHSINATVGEIAYFSSIGPSRDEAVTGFKPEIAAPGQMICSALADDGVVLSPGTQIDRIHVLMQGTSMACPHVNGIVALMLQADPTLTVEKARRIIMKTAARDSFTGTDQNYTWGAGKIRALPAVKMALGIGYCEGPGDCKEGRSCVSARCLQAESGACYAADDCVAGLACTDGKCRKAVVVPDGGPEADGSVAADAETGGDAAHAGKEAGGCGCATLAVGDDDGKGGISETSLDEIANAKPGASKSALPAVKVLKAFERAGMKPSARTEVLGKLVGASYCVQAKAAGVQFVVCEYADPAQVEKGKAKRAEMFGVDERVNGATVLAITGAADAKAKGAAAKLAEIFAAIGKPPDKKGDKKDEEKKEP